MKKVRISYDSLIHDLVMINSHFLKACTKRRKLNDVVVSNSIDPCLKTH